jgi:tRNA(adenine34) deaminase
LDVGVDDERWMREAMAEARVAEAHGDVPIGAVVVVDGEVVARGRNERELAHDPTAHAEVLALRDAAAAIGDGWRVTGATLYVTLEPCTMCAGAIVLSRIPRVVFGAFDPKAGACGSVLSVLDRPELNHRPEVTGGVLEPECAEQLRAFFRARR